MDGLSHDLLSHVVAQLLPQAEVNDAAPLRARLLSRTLCKLVDLRLYSTCSLVQTPGGPHGASPGASPGGAHGRVPMALLVAAAAHVERTLRPSLLDCPGVPIAEKAKFLRRPLLQSAVKHHLDPASAVVGSSLESCRSVLLAGIRSSGSPPSEARVWFSEHAINLAKHNARASMALYREIALTACHGPQERRRKCIQGLLGLVHSENFAPARGKMPSEHVACEFVRGLQSLARRSIEDRLHAEATAADLHDSRKRGALHGSRKRQRVTRA